MSTIIAFGAIFSALFGAIFLGAWLRSVLAAHHLTPETKDTVRLAMGLVSTMAALLLGLLVGAASGSYKNASDSVGDMSAKIVSLDGLLELYGPEAAPARADLRAATEDVVRHVWAEKADAAARLAPRLASGNRAYISLIKLTPRNEMQTNLKAEAIKTIYDAFDIGSLLYIRSTPSVSPFLLAVVVGWLAVIFLSFSIFAPRNGMTTAAMVTSALSVFGALVLIWELDRPFDGLLTVSNEPMRMAIAGVGEAENSPTAR